MAHLEQHILIRTDLGFVPGLYAAQIAHIHAEVMRQHILNGKENYDVEQWLKSPYIFVREVQNPEILDIITKQAKEVKIPYYEWRDTVFSSPAKDVKYVLTNVLVGTSFGPCESDLIKSIGISQLPLFNG